jgi:hypothetical protein
MFVVLSMAYGQKVEKGAMVATWIYSPKAEVNIEKFEGFLENEYIPALKKSFEGVNFFLLKSDRGSKDGVYGVLVVFKSVEARNEWWPEKGQSSEKAKKAMEKMGDISDKFTEMTTMESWNDWVVL